MSTIITHVLPPSKENADKSFSGLFYDINCTPAPDSQGVDITLEFAVGEQDKERPRLFSNGQKAPEFVVQVNTEPKIHPTSPELPLKEVATLNTSTKKIYQVSIPSKKFQQGKNAILILHKKKNNRTSTDGRVPLGYVDVDAGDTAAEPVTNVRLTRPDLQETPDHIFWKAIKAHALNFEQYANFVDFILCAAPDGLRNERNQIRNRSPFIKSDEYNLIKFGTEFYMLFKFGISAYEMRGYVGSSQKLPYYDFIIGRVKDQLKLETVPATQSTFIFRDRYQISKFLGDCEAREYERIFTPFMVELIWSYWMEMGMLVQTLNVINLRFQNIKGARYKDLLFRFDTDPLRPLSHILWGYIQDEQHRLSLPRRLNEYNHEYGLTLTGRAVPRISPVDTRVKFLEAFHSLLAQCLIYFHESDDTTRIADAFPILNSLREVHLLLAEGNHNAYGNLTWTARQEMLMQQYILARPEMREFLGGRVMVPYPERWMDRVDTMRSLQGWGGNGIVHYYELAVHGELILLSIRYGNWSDVNLDRHHAANWAQEFRNSIQRYVHAYRSVTGVDLSVDQIIQLPRNFAVQPTYLVQQRLFQDMTRIKRA